MKQVTEAEILHRMAGYCSLKECCAQEIKDKIRKTGLPEDACANIIERLRKEKFLDDARFANAFVKDKLRFNKWGRIKISYELQRKYIPRSVIEETLSGIDNQEYLSTLQDLLKSKKKTIKGKDEHDVFNKLLRFAIGRGFENGEIIPLLKAMLKDIMDEDSFQ